MEHYFSILERSIKTKWNEPAAQNYNGESFTYGELAVNIAKFHILFEKTGITKGDKIALCAKNTARWITSFLAVSTYEATVVPLLYDFTPESIAHLTAHSDSVMLFTEKEIWEKINPEELPNLKIVVNAADYSLLSASSEEYRKAYEGLVEAFNVKYPMGFTGDNVCYRKENEKDIAVINYTSGTTSAPKGVMLRYECLNDIVDFCRTYNPTRDGDKVVSMLPMGHIYGLMIEVLYPLISGCTITFFGKTPSPTILLKAMKEVRPYMVTTVPLVMEKIFKTSIKPVISPWYMQILLHIPFLGGHIYRKIGRKLHEAFGGQVRMYIMGGAPLNRNVDKCLKKMRLPYTVGYGMTEASPMLAWAEPSKYVPGSCGRPVPGTTVIIDSDDPAHIAGEVLAKGPNICSGYYKNPEANANAFNEDGYFRTGDLGVMDKFGNIYLKGRSKTMILSANGQNIYPEEVEAVVNKQPFVQESVVVDRGGKLVALVYLDRDSIKKGKLDDETISNIPEEIKTNSNKELPSYSKISKIEVVLQPFEKTPKMSIKRFLYK